MRYFFDTEFLEGTQKTWLGKSKPTIDLISIGIVSEDNRQYYAISKDFNLKEAWNRFQLEQQSGDARNIFPEGKKVYWIRENVLKPIFNEWKMESNGKIVRLGLPTPLNEMEFNYKNFKYCIKCIGKTNAQIAFDIVNFTHGYSDMGNWLGTTDEYYNTIIKTEPKDKPEFYAYYADYDWVVFCWLFGSMMNLPKGFPMYCNDLKQDLDRIVNNKAWYYHEHILTSMNYEKDRPATFEEKLNRLKTHQDYPQQVNEHNALADAKWNKRLYEFLQDVK